jgi:hypothetical protein
MHRLTVSETKSSNGTVLLAVRVPAEHFDALKALAEEADRTVSAEARRALRLYLEQEERAA